VKSFVLEPQGREILFPLQAGSISYRYFKFGSPGLQSLPLKTVCFTQVPLKQVSFHIKTNKMLCFRDRIFRVVSEM
jgi:hypothetical protein